MTPQQLLDASLAKCEPTVREWATTDHNLPIWLQLADASIAKHPDASVEGLSLKFSTYVIATCYGM